MEERAPASVGLNNHSEALSIWLDLFRWMAAFEVLLAHIRHRLLAHTPPMHGGLKSLAFYPLGVASSFGAPAVIVFFVLSGFLVGGTSLRKYRKSGHFGFTDYTLARLSRLWTVLIPVFAVTVVLNLLGAHIFHGGAVGVYGTETQDGQVFLAQDPATFACNLAFLQTAVCGQFGQNGALWSLFNEFWYYCAWPLVLITFWSQGPRGLRATLLAATLVVLVGLTCFQFVGPNLALYFTLWLLGVIAADRQRPFLAIRPLASFVVFVFALLIWRLFSRSEVQGADTLYEFPFDFVTALTFSNLIMNMKRLSLGLRFPPFSRVHTLLAGFSFTLYCIHTPLINCIAAFLMWRMHAGWHMVPAGPLPFILFGATTIVCLVVAYGFSLLTERHTHAIRRYMVGLTGSRRRRASPDELAAATEGSRR